MSSVVIKGLPLCSTVHIYNNTDEDIYYAIFDASITSSCLYAIQNPLVKEFSMTGNEDDRRIKKGDVIRYNAGVVEASNNPCKAQEAFVAFINKDKKVHAMKFEFSVQVLYNQLGIYLTQDGPNAYSVRYGEMK